MVFPGKETFDENLAHLRIVVFGIPTWTRKKIFKCFARFGIITGISDVTSRGFAFVQFRTEGAVIKALRAMNKTGPLGNTITVKRDLGPSKKRQRRIAQGNNKFRPERVTKREDLEVESFNSEDNINYVYEERSETSSRASSVNTCDISVSEEECMSDTSTHCEDECEPPEPFEQPDHVEYPENPTASVAEDTNVEEVPMDICIQESLCGDSDSEQSFHSDSTLDLTERAPSLKPAPAARVETPPGIEASTQTVRHYPSPQWNRPSGPNDCLVAQQIGTETYGERVKTLLRKVGIKHSDLFFENLSDAENPIMEHIEKSKEAIYGIFICDSDIKEATISVFSESKLTRNIPLSEAITSLQKHFDLVKATLWNKVRVMKFFLKPMMSSMNGISKEEMQFAIQHVHQRCTFVNEPGPSGKRRSSCETQARHEVPVFGQT